MADPVLWDKTKLTGPSEYGSRNGEKIDTLQVHHMAGRSLAQLIDLMMPGGRKVSANGALDTDGTLVNVVPVWARPFTSASAFDRRSLTVETVNTSGAPGWGISDASHERLAHLLAQMHWTYGTKLEYGVGGLIFHRDVPGTYATACPGPSMDGDRIIRRAREIVTEANAAAGRPAPAGGGSKPAGGGGGRKEIRNGARGDEARWVIDRLIAHGYYVGYRNDEHFGNIAEAELKKFQSAKKLTRDGWLVWGGGQTYDALAADPAKVGKANLPTLRSGYKGRIVGNLQRWFKKFYPAYARHLAVDDWYGGQLKGVVVQFQRRSGIEPDGVVGAKQTWPALLAAGFNPNEDYR